MHRPRPTLRRSGGFTVIELLTVVAVIGILLTILIPTLGKVQENAKKTKTRVQFSQWATAIEGFRQEYGYYPNFDSTNKVNAGTGGAAYLFQELLSGRPATGALPFSSGEKDSSTVQNKRHIGFYSFGNDEIGAGKVVDAFGNTDIAVLVDKNLDGRITKPTGDTTTDDYPSFPAVGMGASPTGAFLPTSDKLPADGIRAGVIFYSAGAGTSNSDVVTSW